MACRIYARVIDDRSGRTVEELVAVIDDDLAPDVALSVFFADEEPPSGTYTADCSAGTATLVYDPSRA